MTLWLWGYVALIPFHFQMISFINFHQVLMTAYPFVEANFIPVL